MTSVLTRFVLNSGRTFFRPRPNPAMQSNVTLATSAQISYTLPPAPWPTEVTRENAAEILDRFDFLVLDCDGVIWHVDHAQRFQGVQNALCKLRQMGKTILFASNNSIPSGQALTEKIHRMTGYESDPSDNFSVNCVIRLKLDSLLDQSKNESVYLLSSKGLEDELTLHGINHFGNGADNTPPSYDLEDISAIPLRDDVKVVLVGQDEHFNFMKLTKAASYLKRKNAAGDWQCQFLATSWETGYEFAPGRVQPIAGSLAQCVSACAGREPVYIGKPETSIFEALMERVPGFDPARACMVGDSLKSDIGFAKRNGIASLAVMSGVSSVEDMKIFEADKVNVHRGMPLRSLLPDFYVGSIMDLANMLD